MWGDFLKCIDYYPPVLQEVEEFKVIANIIDNEFERLSKANANLLKELFIDTAENEGLLRWEKMLNISVSDYNDFELRRFNILARFIFEKTNIVESLNALIGEKNYSLNYFDDVFLLETRISIDYSRFSFAIADLLETTVPLNVALNYFYLKNTHLNLSKYTHKDLEKFTFGELMGVDSINGL